MKRTYRKSRRWGIASFWRDHHRLTIFLLLLALGVAGGLLVDPGLIGWAAAGAKPQPVAGFADGMAQVFASCLSAWCLLTVLFLGGLSACGAPITAAVPLFYGLGLGVTQTLWSADGRWWVSALLLWPCRLPEMVAVVYACCESLRLSTLLAAQLLPGGTMGGLWRDFKWYLTRFLIYFLLALAGGILDVVGRSMLLR
ncbi:MAG: stage II sporulation protein M [Acutalibacteraceae bacterium]|jgi:hypothetical protein